VISSSVHQSNRTYWHDRYIFDAVYADVLFEIVQSAQRWINQQQQQANTPLADDTTEEDKQQQTAHLSLLDSTREAALQLATCFVLEVLCRARNKARLSDWTSLLSGGFQRSAAACRWLLQHMTERSTWSQQILLSCPIVEVRQALATVLTTVLRLLAPTEEAQIHERALTPWISQAQSAPVSAVAGVADADGVAANASALASSPAAFSSPFSPVCDFIDAHVSLLRVVPEWWRRFNQYFAVLFEFSRATPSATPFLLQRHNLLTRLCDLYVAHPDNPFGMPLREGKRTVVGDTLVRPDMTAFLALMAQLVCASAAVKAGVQPPPPLPAMAAASLPGPLVPLSPEAQSLLFSKSVLSRLLSDATSRKRGESLYALLRHLCWENLDVSKQIIGLLVTGIKAEQVDTLRPYMRVVGALLQIDDTVQSTRQDVLLQSLLLIIEQHGAYWKPMDFLIEHLLRIAKQHPDAMRWLTAHPSNVDNLLHWLRTHPVPPRHGEATLLHKPGRVDPAEQLALFDAHDYAAFAPRCFPTLPHPTSQKIALLERIRSGAAIDTRDGSDSDEELSERVFTPGQLVDVLDPARKWLPAHVVRVDTRHVLIHYDNWSNKYDESIPMDSLRITRFGRFSSGTIVEVRHTEEKTERKQQYSRAHRCAERGDSGSVCVSLCVCLPQHPSMAPSAGATSPISQMAAGMQAAQLR
jgi:hypothetical protein